MKSKHSPRHDDDDDEDEVDFAPVARPAQTDIEVDDFEDGLTIRAPALGIRKGVRALLLMGIFICGFMLVLDSLVCFGLLNNKQGKGEGLWIMIGVSVLFWLIGVFMLLAAIDTGRRKAAIALAGGQLTAMQTGLFGAEKRAWPVENIAAVYALPSGMKVNNRPVLELQIWDRDDKVFRMLTGRSDQELFWLAWLLREELGLHKAEGA